MADADAAFRRAPTHDNAVALARVQLERDAFTEALAASDCALACTAASAVALQSRALALEGLGRHAEAVDAWRKALGLDPGNSTVRHSLATLLLELGRLTPDTWALYEGRLDGRLPVGVRYWRGEDVTGQTVLLHAEQGLGDTLQFIRYAPLVAARGARVILAVQASLVRLLASVPGVHQVVAIGAGLPRFDVLCLLLSLPAIFQTTLETVPPPLRYDLVFPEPEPGRLRVGLAWAGNPSFKDDRARSMKLATLAPLSKLPGVRLYSLQFGTHASLPAWGITDLMQGVADFQDTAMRIAGLDLVVTVDTAVAHLAATMGKPVWLLSRVRGCWRWLLGRPDTPWYPGMRILRQSRIGDWSSVVEQVCHDLQLMRAGASPMAMAAPCLRAARAAVP